MTAPQTMRQARFEGAGGPEVIKIGDAPVPAPGAGQVLVKVAAAGVNRPDVQQRGGFYPPPPGATEIPGLEIAGTIVRKVCALVISGGYAQYAVADHALCLPVPAPLSMIEAAGLPETFFTVYDNVFTRGRLTSGETFLVHGGSSGIGSTAIQLAKAFGARVFATAGTDAKCDFCRSLGADGAINYRTQDFVAEIRRLTDKRGVDVILDMVGGDYIQRNLSILAIEGRLVQIAFMKGSKAEVDFIHLLVRRLTFAGSTLRPRSSALKAQIAAHLKRDVWPLLEAGKIKPIVDAVFTLDDARKAHELMDSSAHAGKIILEMPA